MLRMPEQAGFKEKARAVDDFIACRYGESGEEFIITTVDEFQGLKVSATSDQC